MELGSKRVASSIGDAENWLGKNTFSNLSQGEEGNDADPESAIYSLIDGARSNAKPTAHVLEAFVAALELLQPTDNGIHNPLPPKKPPVLARHLLHVCLDSTDLALDLTSPPFFNADAANDRATAPSIGAKLAKLGASISSCAIKPDTSSNGDAATGNKEALAAILGVHKSISEPNKLANEDLSTLLSEAVRSSIFKEANIISSGLTSSPGQRAANVASASTKRSREEDGVDQPGTPTKRSKSGSISTPQPPPIPSAPNEIPRNIKLDPQVSTKVLFLRSQHENMIKNWTAAYTTVSSPTFSPDPKAPGMNKAYLDQLKAQLVTQQQALKMLVDRIISGAEGSPNFNVCLQSLINIDKEAKEMGVHLGGPSNGPQGAAGGAGGRARSGSSTQPPLQSAPSNGVKREAAPTTTTVADSGPTRPKPFWKGALTWSVISDPVTKQKRDVATLVSATSNSSSLDRLLTPWPEKLQITAITQLAPRNLQVYAQSQNAPYILFSTQEPSDSPQLTAATAEKNKQMYTSLASSLDAKKSCAFIRHGSAPGAGLVLFATTQPTSSAERKGGAGGGGVKLIGVVLKESIPFSKLLAAQNGASQPTQQQGSGGGKEGTPTSQGQGRSRTVSASQPPAAPEQQAQPAAAPSSAAGMGLGSSMPFNLAALNAAGNVPVSSVGASSTMGLGINSQPEMNLGQFGMLQQPQGQGQDNSATGGLAQPNLAALAQLLGIGGQAAQQPGQQQALPQFFNQMSQSGFSQPQQPQQQQQGQGQGLFNNLNPFGNGSGAPQQQQQQGAGGGSGDGSSSGGGGGMDFSKPMTMEQLRALGFIQ